MKTGTFRLLMVLVVILMLGCSAESLVGVDRTEPNAVTAGKNAKTVPFKGDGTLEVVPAAGTVACLAPDNSVVALFPAQFDALARYSHLGRTTGVITADACQLNPADGTLVVPGEVLQTAANGDELHATYVAVFHPPGYSTFGLEVVMTGGTGRFEGTSGWAAGEGTIDHTTGRGTSRLDGRISTVGSD